MIYSMAYTSDVSLIFTDLRLGEGARFGTSCFNKGHLWTSIRKEGGGKLRDRHFDQDVSKPQIRMDAPL